MNSILMASDGGRLRHAKPQLSGRDAYLFRLEHMLDAEPEELEKTQITGTDGEPLNGRDAYVRWLEEYRP